MAVLRSADGEDRHHGGVSEVLGGRRRGSGCLHRLRDTISTLFHGQVVYYRALSQEGRLGGLTVLYSCHMTSANNGEATQPTTSDDLLFAGGCLCAKTNG